MFPDLAYRLAMRLHNFHQLLIKIDDKTRAAQVRDERRELVSTKLADDPRGVSILAGVEAHQAYIDGDRSETTLAGLVGGTPRTRSGERG